MADRITTQQRVRIFGSPPVEGPRILTPWGLWVFCHPLVTNRFHDACLEADHISSWTPRRIDSFANRPIRGSKSVSLHAFSLAWDFFDRPYPEPVDVWGPTNAPDAAFRAAFERHGFYPGAKFHERPDFAHIEWAAGRPTTTPSAEPPQEDDMTQDEHDRLTRVERRAANTEAWVKLLAHKVGITDAQLNEASKANAAP